MPYNLKAQLMKYGYYDPSPISLTNPLLMLHFVYILHKVQILDSLENYLQSQDSGYMNDAKLHKKTNRQNDIFAGFKNLHQNAYC